MPHLNRRQFLEASAALAALPAATRAPLPGVMPVEPASAAVIPKPAAGLVVNDVHSQLNSTHVSAIAKPTTIDELRAVILRAKQAGTSISIAGGRHAMGGQQFLGGGVLIDTTSLNRVLGLDVERGWLTVEGGIQWPAIVDYLNASQKPGDPQWGIVQKQTGADRLSLAGALACNAHGRGLTLAPIVQQVEALDLMDHDGAIRTCSRATNPELFRLAIGGYGLFGLITRVVLRLQPRMKLRRVVELADTATIIDRFDERIRDGFLYGDSQFTTDPTSESFLRRGILSCYEPVAPETPLTDDPAHFTSEDWARLIRYAHTQKRLAFDVYSSRYLETSGQVYEGDAQAGAVYLDDYHADVDRATGAAVKGSEMITEIYVPRLRLATFMTDAAAELIRRDANVIYGTVRLIEQDTETFLPWARERYACVIFNLHVEHTPRAIEHAAEAFRALIDLGIRHGGSYYLTYHRWARKDQVEKCYPQMREFLAHKRRYDPDEVFQSDWYRHHREMFA